MVTAAPPRALGAARVRARRNFIRHRPSHPLHEMAKNGFHDYLSSVPATELRCQKDYIADEDGKIIIDFVGRYERLSNDFNQVCKLLGISTLLPHLNKSSSKDYRLYYNDKTSEMVQDVFRDDIESFGYSFDPLE